LLIFSFLLVEAKEKSTKEMIYKWRFAFSIFGLNSMYWRDFSLALCIGIALNFKSDDDEGESFEIYDFYHIDAI